MNQQQHQHEGKSSCLLNRKQHNQGGRPPLSFGPLIRAIRERTKRDLSTSLEGPENEDESISVKIQSGLRSPY